MDMEEEFNNLPLEGKIRYIRDKRNLSEFSTANYANPKIAKVFEELYKEIQALKKNPAASKDKEIVAIKDLIAYFEEKGDKEMAESMKMKLQDIIGGKKGLFPYLNVKLKVLGISIPVVTAVVLAGIGSSVWYLATKTDIFKVVGKLNSYEAKIQEAQHATATIKEYSKKIDDFMKKYSAEEANQTKSINGFEESQKKLEERLQSYSSDFSNQTAELRGLYEKQNFESSSIKSSIEGLKATQESDGKEIQGLKKDKENLEKRLDEHERSLKANNELYNGK